MISDIKILGFSRFLGHRPDLREFYGQRESNLEGISIKTVRVIFLPKIGTLQNGGSNCFQISDRRPSNLRYKAHYSDDFFQRRPQNPTKQAYSVIITINLFNE